MVRDLRHVVERQAPLPAHLAQTGLEHRRIRRLVVIGTRAHRAEPAEPGVGLLTAATNAMGAFDRGG